MNNFTSFFWRNVDSRKRAICERHMAALPVSVGKLAKELRLEVVASTLKSGVSGEIRPNKKTNFEYLIKVNRHENKYRQRFTVAHEIGHALLHGEYIGEGIIDSVLYRSNVSDAIEAQANQIAADILMPRKTLNTWIKQHYPNGVRDSDLPNVSRYIRVSKVALKIRLGM